MVLKHEGGNIGSKMNRKKVEALISNPKTILVGSKSYMEWVDIPGENLSLVVLWKLPFLPPSPFSEYKNEETTYRNIPSSFQKYVYNFMCSIPFRQAIWRLIRTKDDTGEILILDPRLNTESWKNFQDYLVNETILTE